MLAETGEAKLSVSSFAAVWNHDSDTLTVWRLDRRTHELRQLATRPTPADFTAYYGPVTPGQWRLMADASGTIAGTPLPDCAGALTRCAVRRTPEPFTVRERRIIDPTAGVTLLGLGRKVVIEPWSMQTPVLVERARGESVAALAARVLAAARVNVAETLAKTGELPSAPSATLLDAGVARGTEKITAEYAVEPGGQVTARLTYGDDPPLSLRWKPSAALGPDGLPAAYECEAEQADTVRWIAGCHYKPRLGVLDPELAHLVNSGPQLVAKAAGDSAYQRAQRGVTFGVRSTNADENLTWVACVGLPGTRVGGCDMRRGDTECSASLPLLCLNPDAAGIREPGADLKGHWLEARIAASAPVRGTDLKNRDRADARCATQFGRGWRVARWSDHGEDFIASGSIRRAARMWIDSPETSAATCWAPRQSHQEGRVEVTSVKPGGG